MTAPIRPSLGACAALGVVLAAGCEFDQVNKPSPPDTTALQQRLESPDGRFGEGSSASDIFTTLEQASQGYKALCGLEPLEDPECLTDQGCRQCAALRVISDALDKVVSSLGESDDSTDAGTPSTIPGVRGLLEVDTVCQGFEDEPTPDPGNGGWHATVGFTGAGIDPTVWGELEECAFKHELGPVRATGDFVMEFEAPAVRRANLENTPLLFSFKGGLELLKEGQSVTTDAVVKQRLDGIGELQLGLLVPELGSFTLTATNDAATVEGGAGTFSCAPEEGECVLSEMP